MWETLLLQFIEWVASKGAAVVWTEISAAIAKHKENAALSNNQSALQNAETSGSTNAVDQAGQNSLNNTGGQ